MVKFPKIVALAGALAALPGMAQAGTSSTTSTASFNVASQCSVTGATVNLGTFNTNQSWVEVAVAHGWDDGVSGYNYRFGSRGQSSLNYGSVNCAAGTPYTLQIKGSAGSVDPSNAGAIRFVTSGGGNMVALPAIRSLGGQYIPNDPSSPRWPTGVHVWNRYLNGTGTGVPQDLLGNVTFLIGWAGPRLTGVKRLAPIPAPIPTHSTTP